MLNAELKKEPSVFRSAFIIPRSSFSCSSLLKIHTVQRGFSPPHSIDILGDFFGDALQAEIGRSANMRRGDHIVGENLIGRVEWLVPKNIETSAGDAAFFECCKRAS